MRDRREQCCVLGIQGRSAEGLQSRAAVENPLRDCVTICKPGVEVCRPGCLDEMRTERQEGSDNSSDHHAVPGLGTRGEDTRRVRVLFLFRGFTVLFPMLPYMRQCLTTEKLEPGMAGILPSAWCYFS